MMGKNVGGTKNIVLWVYQKPEDHGNRTSIQSKIGVSTKSSSEVDSNNNLTLTKYIKVEFMSIKYQTIFQAFLSQGN